MRAVFSNRAYTAVLAETTEKIKTETGGLFLGTIKDDIWYIIEAIDPGPKSIFEVAYFEYDRDYTQHLINKIANIYNEKLTLIGLWHRHPGSFDQFSSTDDETNTKYASMRKEGALSALVNIDPTFRITMYRVERPCCYRKISYEVGDNLIPDKFLKLKTPESFYVIMDNLQQPSLTSRKAVEGYHKSLSLASFMKFISLKLQNVECTDLKTNNLSENEYIQEQIIDEIIDDLTFMADTLGIETAISLEDDSLVVYQEAIDITTRLCFMFFVAKNTVVVSYDDKRYIYHKGLFREAFKKAKTEKDKEDNFESRDKLRQQVGVIDSVIKLVGYKRNEE